MIPTLIVALVLKVLMLALPVAVSILALRRMLQSESANAWLYGATAIFGIVTAFGILPWAMGFAPPQGAFLALSALTPMVWMAVVLLCDRDRANRYDIKGLGDGRAKPLVLTNPVEPQVPVFRHSKPEPVIHAISLAPTRAEPPVRAGDDDRDTVRARSVLAVAREMRSGTSARRRDGHAPHAPHPSDLPFLDRATV